MYQNIDGYFVDEEEDFDDDLSECYPEDDYEIVCSRCGMLASDQCVCGVPLCHRCFELGAGFCDDRSDAHEKLIEDYCNGEEREWEGDET